MIRNVLLLAVGAVLFSGAHAENSLTANFNFFKRKFKPIIVSHHMLYGMKAGQEKVSKSDPDSAIFMEDEPKDVERKIEGRDFLPLINWKHFGTSLLSVLLALGLYKRCCSRRKVDIGGNNGASREARSSLAQTEKSGSRCQRSKTGQEGQSQQYTG
jgi:hypothetical protein